MNRKNQFIEQRLSARCNNFGILRLIAATLVVYSHSFDLVKMPDRIDGFADPLWNRFHYTIGSVAVDMFFLISGLLCAKSMAVSPSVKSFVWKRVVRILPGMAGCVVWMLLISCAFFHMGDIINFLISKQTIQFVFYNITLLLGVRVKLDGVFNNESINGSLWTMPVEVRMYALLAISCVTAGLCRVIPIKLLKRPASWWLHGICLSWFVVAALWLYAVIMHEGMSVFMGYSRFLFFFGGGLAVYALRQLISVACVFRYNVFLCLLMAVGLIFYVPVVQYIYPLWIVVFVFAVAFVDHDWFLKLRDIPDYSYGLYLYAWPTQRSIVHLYPDVSVLQLFMFACLITMGLAAVSWHCIEKPMLRLK